MRVLITIILVLTLTTLCQGSKVEEGLRAWNSARSACGGDLSCKRAAEDVFRAVVNEAFMDNELGVITPCEDGWGYYTYDTREGWNQDAPLPC